MSHYRTITIEDKDYKFCVGRHQTHIRDVGTFPNHLIGHTTDSSMDKYMVTPSMVEKVIRRELGIPQRHYEWDVPATKKDPGPKTRGFRNLIGAEIVDIRVSAINEVILEDRAGTRYAIETNDSVMGIGVISLRVLDQWDAAGEFTGAPVNPIHQ